MAAADLAGSAFRRCVEEVEFLADRELRSVAGLGGRLVEITSRGLAALDEDGGSITRGMAVLRRWTEELRPPHELVAGRSRRRLGIFPGRDPSDAYQSRWQSAQEPIREAVAELRDAAGGLRADNAAIDQQQTALTTGIATLTGFAYLAEQLDRRLDRYIGAMEPVDAGRARVVRDDLLYTARRRRQDILAQLAVAHQGLAALVIVAEHNRELIAAVEHATTTTLSALQAATAALQALQGRRRLDARLAEVAGGGGAEVESLSRAWAGVAVTLNEAEVLRRQVLESVSLLGRMGDAPGSGPHAGPGQPGGTHQAEPDGADQQP